MSIQQKENALNALLRAVPGSDSMEVQDALFKCNWDVDEAIEELRNRPQKTNKRTAYSSLKPTHQNGGAKKARRASGMDNGEDSDGPEYEKERVFDSDDSGEDGDYKKEMNIQRKEVWEFFNNANIGELTSIKSCSLKKAEIIIENRPYRNWEELVIKFQVKPLQPELLNNCQEYLDKRNSLKKLMKKCKQIVLKLERAVSEGAGITEQPFCLNEGLQLSDYQLVSCH